MPIPPPGGHAAPSDDWSEDPSFDLGSDKSFSSSGGSPSSLSSSRNSLSGRVSGSPLRQMHNKMSLFIKPLPERDDEDDDFDFDDLPDAFPTPSNTIKGPLSALVAASSTASSSTPKASSRTTSGGSSSSLRSLTATVVGQGPTGVGTITRLGAATKRVSGGGLPMGSVRARAKAIEKAWEADVDFSSVPAEPRLKKLSLSPGRAKPMPDANALDALGFDLDDEDQDTLRAGATIKAMLPPPRRREGSGTAYDTIKAPPPPPAAATPVGTIKGPRAPPPPLKLEEDDLEDDLVLPLNLTNLTLATQSSAQPRVLRPRASMASVTTDWDSPSTASTSGRKAGAFWGDESPGHRTSETSMTSVSDEPHEKSSIKHDDMDDDDEGFEADLVIPDMSLFAARRTNVLNSILDRKRKQQYAPPPPPERQRTETARGDDSFEDGLVFDNPRTDLSSRRLEKEKTRRSMRTVPVPFTLGAERKQRTVSGDRERLGRQSPTPNVTSRAGGASLGHTTGLRNVSGGAPTPREPGGALRTRPESPLVVTREIHRAQSRPRLISGGDMPPPPVPSSSTAPSSARPEPTTPSRLRTQKSFHYLPPSPSPSVVRKQSLASLQDAYAGGHQRADAEPPHHLDPHPHTGPQLRQMYSTSRLTMPTSSSLAKMRPPIHNSFPRAGEATRPRSRMEATRRTKQWGDGTELEGIEDLRVDTSSTPASARPRKSLENKSPVSTLRGEPSELRKKTMSSKRRPRQPAMLIKNLGAVDKRKVVGDMTWNPQTLRWEGNEAILRDFDVVASSTRPALIAHYTGSSLGSPLTTAPSSVRIVGDMKFDPEKMCWVSLRPPEEDEPDPFEGMADDEDEDHLRGTISRAPGRKLVSIGLSSAHGSAVTGSALSQRFVSDTSHSIANSTASWEERTLPQLGTEIPPELWAECKEAEDRHRREMRGWTLRPAQSTSDLRDRERREEKRLWEVRNLALRS